MAGAIFSKKIPGFYPKRISLPAICIVNLFSKAMSTRIRTIFQTAYFFISVLVDWVLNCSGGQFQNIAILIIPTHKNQHGGGRFL